MPVSATYSTLEATTHFVVKSGMNGSEGTGTNAGVGGSAGAVTMDLESVTLIAPIVNLIKNDGALTTNIGTLDVGSSTPGTTLDLIGTAASDVTIANVSLNNDKTFTVSGTGAATITNLNVTGTGGTVNTAASQTIGTVNLAGGATLTDSGGLSFNTMNVQGLNATYGGDLVATGATISFDLPATLSQGNTFLTVTGSADLTGSTLLLKAQNPLTMLNTDDDFTLVSATGTLTDGGFNGAKQEDALGNKYNLSVLNDTLYATLADLRTFEEIIGDAFGGTGQNNSNLENGASYLDEISVPGVIDPGLAADIGNAFNDAIAAGGVGSVTSSRSTQQFFGAYSAYANQALSSDMNRFRRRWQGQNRHFFDTRLFEGVSSTVSEGVGVASDSGLASPRYGARDTIACGQPRIWAGGFGTWAEQKNKSNYAGYKYDSQGVVLGYEYSIGNLNLGFAAAYSRGDLKVNDLRYKNEADVLNLALYGAYIHESGFYAEGGLGYGHAWNDYRADMLLGGRKTGKYGSDIFSADLELGYIARLACGYNLIPSVGLEYDYIRNDSWTEKVANSAALANRFASGHDNGVDIPLGLRFNKMFRFGCDGGFVVPEARAAYVYSANKSRPSITAGFAGAPGGAKMVGVDPGRSHWRVGAGLSGRINSRVDFRVDYDFETRSGFKGHNLNASVGLSF